jgi:hypothetical protein
VLEVEAPGSEDLRQLHLTHDHRQHFSLRIEAAEHGQQLPDTRARIEAFLTRMAHRGCAAATQNQAFNALLFLYEQSLGQKMPDDIQALRAKRPQQHRTDPGLGRFDA